MGFLETKIRETKPKKKGLVAQKSFGKLDFPGIAQRISISGDRVGVKSSRVAAMGLFFYFVLITLLDAYVSFFFFSLSFLLIRMSCDLLYLRGGGRGWNSDAVVGYKDFLNDSEAGDGEV